MLAKKLARCREAGLTPIYCLGETAEERDAGLTASTLVRQVDTLAGDPRGSAARRGLRAGLGDRHRPGGDARRTPSGRARTSASLLSARRSVRILYGGSVTPENAAALASGAGMDGFLIGGASLSAAALRRSPALDGPRPGA